MCFNAYCKGTFCMSTHTFCKCQEFCSFKLRYLGVNPYCVAPRLEGQKTKPLKNQCNAYKNATKKIFPLPISEWKLKQYRICLVWLMSFNNYIKRQKNYTFGFMVCVLAN